MQSRDPMRERARLDAANRAAAFPTPSPPTAAMKRHVARARGKQPMASATARAAVNGTLGQGQASAAPAQPNHGGPKQKPIW